MNKLISTKNRILKSLVEPSDSGKTYLIHEWLKVGAFQSKFDKTYFFHQHPQPIYDVMQKEFHNLEFVQGVHFEFINSLKNNGTKYLLFLDDSCAEICTSKEFLDIATASRHRGFITNYIKHNLFHQSKVGSDVQMQTTHIVLFKSPRDVNLVATLSVQLGLGPSLVDWYRDATSVPIGHLLIDLSPRTHDRLRYCTNSGNNPSKVYVPDNLKHLKYLDDGYTKSLYSPSIPALFPRMQNSVSKNWSKRIYPISQRVHHQPAARKLVISKKKTRPKVERRNSRTVFKKNQFRSNEEVSFRRKKDYCLIKQSPLSSLFIYLEMEQFVLLPLSVYNSSISPTIVTNQELHKYKPEQTPRYRKDKLKKEINQQLSSNASPLVNKTLESPRIKLSNSNTLILDGIETGVLSKDFAQRLKRKNVPIPDIYFTLLYLTQPPSLPTLLSTVMPRVKKEGLGSLSKSQRQKMQRLYTQGFGAYRSVRNFAKAAKLSPLKVREFDIQRHHILGSHKQHVKYKEWEPLRDSKMKIGEWI